MARRARSSVDEADRGVQDQHCADRRGFEAIAGHERDTHRRGQQHHDDAAQLAEQDVERRRRRRQPKSIGTEPRQAPRRLRLRKAVGGGLQPPEGVRDCQRVPGRDITGTVHRPRTTFHRPPVAATPLA